MKTRILSIVLLGMLSASAEGLKATKLDVDFYGGIASENFTTGRGSIGGRVSLWGNTVSKDFSNIGLSIAAESDKYNKGSFVDRGVVSIAYRLPEFTKSAKLVPELRAGGGYDFEKKNPIAEVTLGGRYYITRNLSFGSAIGPRLAFRDTTAKWQYTATAFVGIGF